MSALLMTGFPGFLGSALLPKILARREGSHAYCLVQEHWVQLATERLQEIEAAHPHTAGRISLIEGDITIPGLGIDYVDRARVNDVTEVWHLAAVYDLAVPESVARRVNVEGTAHVIEFCLGCPDFRRLQYVSTCYVSGNHHGEFGEDDLDLGQGFLNHYEATKFEAEVLVRRAMKAGLPATIYRPGIVVGDSRTGETQKYDGPYMYATYMTRLPRVALIPGVGDFDVVRAGLVPRDYVIGAMDVLSVMDKSEGRTYALTDPNPPTTGEVVQILADYLHRKPVRVPLPLGLTRAVVAHVPGLEKLLGLPAEALDYLAAQTTYSTKNTVADLEGTGVECPPFASYAERLLDYMTAHPEHGASAMT
ncbi:MAG: SDR family oxidoreductase [Actinomycetia bacterium]|jgi:thioester reductase-like protein|nr:SDR family oxidoreductase [Actinomycetes bacterium]